MMGKQLFLRQAVVVTLLSLAFAPARSAFEDAMSAVERGDYAFAVQEYERLAQQGDADSQFNLGLMYYRGEGVQADYTKARRWLTKAAEQGIGDASLMLSILYRTGQGVDKDEIISLYWIKRAAEGGVPFAQFHLGKRYIKGQGAPRNERAGTEWVQKAAHAGLAEAQSYMAYLYHEGLGVPKDRQLEYFWLLLAGSGGNEFARTVLPAAERLLSSAQREEAQLAARSWKPMANTADSGSTRGARRAESKPGSTSSGFRVTATQIVTNYHVVDGCSIITLSDGEKANLEAHDSRNDLALLVTHSKSEYPASIRTRRVKVGESITAAGYPLQGLLGGFNFTAGNVSSLSGIGGDVRLLQISAPTQPGNSGGPLLDASGLVAGVIVSKLDALKIAEATGDVPQNVNFAINVKTLASFLDAHGVEYQEADSKKPVPPVEMAERAKRFTELVKCWK